MSKISKTIGHIAGNIISLFISLIVLIPLVVLLLNSFKTSAEADKMTLSLRQNGYLRIIPLSSNRESWCLLSLTGFCMRRAV